MLFDAAAACGVQALSAAPLRALDRESGGWKLDLGSTPRRMSAPFTVDATGRRACVARRQGSCRRMRDPMMARVRWFAVAAEAGRPAVTEIEAAADGWWYCAPLPHNEAVAVHLTLPERRSAGGVTFKDESWTEAVRNRPWRDAFGGARPLETTACRAESSLLDPVHGADWLAVGDAALAVDPLSGDGVLRSMTMGAAAAHAIAAHLGGSYRALEAYAESVVSCHRQYAASERLFYAREQRWEASPFWARRHSGLPMR
jgi:flavin-dependent dehydrogenase